MTKPWIAPDLHALLTKVSDEQILALTLFGEASSEPIEGIVAVGNVIANRRTDEQQRWGRTWRRVCLQPSQFSCWNPIGGEKNYARLLKMTTAVVEQGKALKHPPFEQCAWVALGIARNALFDRVKHSNHYHTAALSPRPSWAQNRIPALQVHRHVFYAL